jgi:hypothetical protein
VDNAIVQLFGQLDHLFFGILESAKHWWVFLDVNTAICKVLNDIPLKALSVDSMKKQGTMSPLEACTQSNPEVLLVHQVMYTWVSRPNSLPSFLEW